MKIDYIQNFRFLNFIAPKRMASTFSTHGAVRDLSQAQLNYGLSKSLKQDQWTAQIK